MSQQRCHWSTAIVCCIVVATCVSDVTTHPPSRPVVQIAEGKLRGKTVRSWTGKEILSFIGVRFAEPPTGQLRFKAPLPAKAWEGVREAVEDSALCMQPVPSTIKISEDCLFLNVHTKSLRGRQPVIIYFHPGGFVGGTGNNRYTGPQYLLDHDVVLVTANYRLGPFGFLSTGDAVVRGNFGLLDQLEAMRWVRRNIARFGGDPNSVTLFGYSAGGASVQHHMLSPLSKGLFHKAISGSCSATTPAVLNRDPTSLSRRFAKLLNCKTENSQQIRDCLVALPAADVLAATNKIWDTLQQPFSLFAPVVERHSEPGKFLEDDPVALISAGKFSQVPLITGFTRDEFNWRAQFLLTNDTYVRRINEEFNEIAPWEFHYPRQPPELSARISKAFKGFYFKDQPIGNNSEKELGELYADSLIIFSVYQASKLIAEKSSAPVYFYLFDFEGRFSYRYKLGTNIPYGVGHHDDLIYLFYSEGLFPDMFNRTDPEAYMVRALTNAYAKFAQTGSPRLLDSEAHWEPMTADRPRYLDLKRPPTMRAGLPYTDRMRLWESLLPLDQPYRQLLY